MPEKIKWTVQFQAIGGPGISKSDELGVEAYDRILATIPKGGVVKKVEIQPSPDPGDVKLIVVTAKTFGSGLTYKPGDMAGPVGPVSAMDGPHVFIGAGAVALLGANPPQALYFSNNLTEDVAVQVLVGRKSS